MIKAPSKLGLGLRPVRGRATRQRKLLRMQTLMYALDQQSTAACRLFRNHRFQEAGTTLISATPEITEAERPMTLTFLFATVISLFHETRYDIVLSLLRIFSALAKILMDAGRPLRWICGGLLPFILRNSRTLLPVVLRPRVTSLKNS